MHRTLPSVLHPTSDRPRPLRRLLGFLALSRSRRRLEELDDHLLRDLGLTRGEAQREAERLDWDVPAHWLR